MPKEKKQKQKQKQKSNNELNFRVYFVHIAASIATE